MTWQLLEQIRHHAATRPEQPAVVEINRGGAEVRVSSYAQLQQAVCAVANAIRAELPHDAIVAIQLPNTTSYVVAYLATIAAGLKAFPLHPLITDAEIEQVTQRTHTQAIITDRRPPPSVRPIRPEQIDAWCRLKDTPRPTAAPGEMILQSSGTTGKPKLIVRTASSVDAVATNVAQSVGLKPGDRVLAVIPLCHSYGIENGLTAPLWAGATIQACPGFDLRLMKQQLAGAGISVLPAVPVMIEALAHSDIETHACPALRLAYSAGAQLPKPVIDAFGKRLGLTPGQLYGATEIGSVTFNHPDRKPFDPMSVGQPMPGVSIRIVDPDAPDPEARLAAGVQGHVLIAAPSMLDRALGDEPEMLIDGHYATGDLGTLDEHGALTITGRLKLLIDVGGMKVNPYEVEAVIAEHDTVAQCVVTPVMVNHTLARLHALVKPRDAKHSIDVAGLRRYARRRLAGYKVPRQFTVIDELPRTSLGKVRRQALIGQTS